jgi:hypothetical protein
MKTIYFSILSLLFFSCGVKNIHKMSGDKRIETGIESRKYQDNNNEYFAIVVGEHGDEGEARRLSIVNASIEFATKAEAMVNSAVKQDATQSMNNKVGQLDIEAKRTIITKAATNNMVLVEDALYYNEDQQVYKYRAVYKLDVKKILKTLGGS